MNIIKKFFLHLKISKKFLKYLARMNEILLQTNQKKKYVKIFCYNNSKKILKI